MRFVNRILAALVALGLIIGGLLLIVEVIAQRAGSAPVLVRWDSAYQWASKTTWESNTLRIVFVVMAIVGLILLIAQFKRASVKRLRVATSADNVDVAYTRRGIAMAVKAAAVHVDGVRRTSALVTKKSVRVTATAASTEAAAAKSLTQSVNDAVQKQINDLDLDPSPRVNVTMRARRN
ncbi:MAG: DUF6286 domain-containing protein [Antricoccus sp.]